VPTRLAVFRADASPDIGTGHVIRSRTLAQALAARGWATMLAARAVPDALVETWPGGAAAVVRLPAGASFDAEPALITSSVGRGAALVVGDHYGLAGAWFEDMRRSQPGAVLLAIDDLATGRWPVDIVLNQNLGVEPDSYAGLVAAGARVLLGPRFALVRPAFAALRERGRARDGQVHRLLVFMSGADRADITRRAATALAALDRPFDVVVGGAYEHLPAPRDLLAGTPRATLHVNTDSMAELMDRADLAVGAPSSASWERCALGLPTVLITLADNQVEVGRELDRIGAGLALGWHASVTAQDIAGAIGSLSADPARVAAMSRAAARVTDGLGTERVLHEIDSLVSGRMPGP
jgi:UDP-2,4-diacetamido-2,4,6-trideoxy-beta-L-altropyranose hydrolase